MNDYTEDHLFEKPAIQLMQHELGWDVVNCYDEWNGGVSNQGRDGKREVVLVSRLRPALQRLNPDLPVEAIEGAVENVGILNDGFWILNGRGRRRKVPRRVDFLISLKMAISQSAETVEFTEIECLQDFTDSTTFTAC